MSFIHSFIVAQVGQRVTARHPVTRQLHDGDILTTGGAYYRHAALACCMPRIQHLKCCRVE